MPKALTQEEFLIKSKAIHGEKYDYSVSIYKNRRSKVSILCLIHGEFLQKADSHLSGKGCPKCSPSALKTLDKFLEEAKLVHGNRYDYSDFVYTGYDHKSIIVCHIHGEFLQTPDNHIHGKSGCPKCCGKNKTTEDFINMSKQKHGNLYKYSKSVYIDCYTKIIITCAIHGDFHQTPSNHLCGAGCPKCCGKNKNTESFIQEARQIHGNKYSYDRFNYQGAHMKGIITCIIHGDFELRANNHLLGIGCPKCSYYYSKKCLKWINSFNNKNIITGFKNKIINSNTIREFDGFDPTTNTIYEFYGDYWHGNPDMFSPNDFNEISKKSFGDLYNSTINREELIKSFGFNLITIWENDWDKKCYLNKPT